jgi:hypothetical protein
MRRRRPVAMGWSARLVEAQGFRVGPLEPDFEDV